MNLLTNETQQTTQQSCLLCLFISVLVSMSLSFPIEKVIFIMRANFFGLFLCLNLRVRWSGWSQSSTYWTKRTRSCISVITDACLPCMISCNSWRRRYGCSPHSEQVHHCLPPHHSTSTTSSSILLSSDLTPQPQEELPCTQTFVLLAITRVILLPQNKGPIQCPGSGG